MPNLVRFRMSLCLLGRRSADEGWGASARRQQPASTAGLIKGASESLQPQPLGTPLPLACRRADQGRQ